MLACIFNGDGALQFLVEHGFRCTGHEIYETFDWTHLITLFLRFRSHTRTFTLVDYNEWCYIGL